MANFIDSGYAEHQELLDHVVKLQKKSESGKTAISFELMHLLKTWLTQHILEEDMRYSGLFLAAGAQPKLAKKSWAKNYGATCSTEHFL